MAEILRTFDLQVYKIVSLSGGCGEGLMLKKGKEIAAIVTTINGHTWLEPRSGFMASLDEHEEVVLKK